MITKDIKDLIPDEWDEPDLTCPRCKCCDMIWEDCWNCGGEGGRDGDDLMSEDPLWYSPDDFEICDVCEGKGGFWICDCDENGKHETKLKPNDKT